MEAFITIEIQDPRKPGDYLVINARDFDRSRHRLRSEPILEPEEVMNEAASPAEPDADAPPTSEKPRRGRPPKAKE